MKGLDRGRESTRNGVKLVSVTVSTNEREWLSECFGSILASDLRGVELVCILVDNASTDGSAELVAERFPAVEVIRNARNEGFSKANNQGMQRAMELNADYVLLLNPDTRTPIDTLRQLVAFAEEWPEYGIIGPLQYRYTSDGSPTDDLNEWSTVALRRGEAHIHVESWPDHSSPVSPLTGRAPRTVEYAYVQAAAFLCRVEVLHSIGLFDTTYHTYYEEPDLCRRARWAGWRVALLLDVGVQHYGGGNTQHSLYRRRLMLRNKYYFLFTDPEWRWPSALRLACIWLRLDLTCRSDVPAPTRAGAWGDTVRGLWWLIGKIPRFLACRRALRCLCEQGSGGPLRLKRESVCREEREVDDYRVANKMIVNPSGESRMDLS